MLLHFILLSNNRKGNKMKINAILDKVITAETAKRLAAEAVAVKPCYNVVAGDDADTGAWVALDKELDSGRTGDFAVFDRRTYEDGSFIISIGYHSEMSDNLESVEVYTDLDEDTGEWSLGIEVRCETTRGAFRERIRPILYAFGVHPSELTVNELETEAGSRFGDYRGAAMPWWATKGEFAYFLACGRIEGLGVAEQIGYDAELIHEAVTEQLAVQFDERNYPRWVVEFRSDLESEAASDSSAATQCRRLVKAWDKFTQATKDLVYGVKEEFQKL